MDADEIAQFEIQCSKLFRMLIDVGSKENKAAVLHGECILFTFRLFNLQLENCDRVRREIIDCDDFKTNFSIALDLIFNQSHGIRDIWTPVHAARSFDEASFIKLYLSIRGVEINSNFPYYSRLLTLGRVASKNLRFFFLQRPSDVVKQLETNMSAIHALFSLMDVSVTRGAGDAHVSRTEFFDGMEMLSFSKSSAVDNIRSKARLMSQEIDHDAEARMALFPPPSDGAGFVPGEAIMDYYNNYDANNEGLTRSQFLHLCLELALAGDQDNHLLMNDMVGVFAPVPPEALAFITIDKSALKINKEKALFACQFRSRLRLVAGDAQSGSINDINYRAVVETLMYGFLFPFTGLVMIYTKMKRSLSQYQENIDLLSIASISQEDKDALMQSPVHPSGLFSQSSTVSNFVPLNEDLHAVPIDRPDGLLTVLWRSLCSFMSLLTSCCRQPVGNTVDQRQISMPSTTISSNDVELRKSAGNELDEDAARDSRPSEAFLVGTTVGNFISKGSSSFKYSKGPKIRESSNLALKAFLYDIGRILSLYIVGVIFYGFTVVPPLLFIHYCTGASVGRCCVIELEAFLPVFGGIFSLIAAAGVRGVRSQLVSSSSFRLQRLRLRLRAIKVVCRDLDLGIDVDDTAMNLLAERVVDQSSRRSRSHPGVFGLMRRLWQYSYIQVIEPEVARMIIIGNLIFSLGISITPGMLRLLPQNVLDTDNCTNFLGHSTSHLDDQEEVLQRVDGYIAVSYLLCAFVGCICLGLVIVRLYVQFHTILRTTKRLTILTEMAELRRGISNAIANTGIIPLKDDCIASKTPYVMSLMRPQNVVAWSKMRMYLMIKYKTELVSVQILLGCILLFVITGVIFLVIGSAGFLSSSEIVNGTWQRRVTGNVVVVLSAYVIFPFMIVMETGVEVNALLESHESLLIRTQYELQEVIALVTVASHERPSNNNPKPASRVAESLEVQGAVASLGGDLPEFFRQNTNTDGYVKLDEQKLSEKRETTNPLVGHGCKIQMHPTLSEDIPTLHAEAPPLPRSIDDMSDTTYQELNSTSLSTVRRHIERGNLAMYKERLEAARLLLQDLVRVLAAVDEPLTVLGIALTPAFVQTIAVALATTVGSAIISRI